MTRVLFILLSFFLIFNHHSWARSEWGDDNDLLSFVSRPDIKAPKLVVSVHQPDLQSHGHFLVAPYGDLIERQRPSKLYIPQQIGPHIYNSHGTLLWSGAHLLHSERPAFDFRSTFIDGVQQFSLLLTSTYGDSQYKHGAALMLDSNLEFKHELKTFGHEGSSVNMHEFNIVNGGKSAIYIVDGRAVRNVSSQGRTYPFPVLNQGFVEKDIVTGRILFEWWALDHIEIAESTLEAPKHTEFAWDWLHLNSIDKDANGDYLISGRYTSTIYKVSGRDGSIIWRLGGLHSSFHLDNFTFSYQHDARFQSNALLRQVSPQFEVFGSTHRMTVISLLNNDGAFPLRLNGTSAGLILVLNEENMMAKVAREFPRPDGRITPARGNMQLLPNNNALLCWSSGAYMTEFSPDGKAILDARFASSRFVTYRAYKFKFETTPLRPPDLKAFVYGTRRGASSTSVFYVSWNGATNVKEWRFYGIQGTTATNTDSHNSKESRASAKGKLRRFQYLGNIEKQGFESMFMFSGVIGRCYTEAVSANGTVLRRSPIVDSTLPPIWSNEHTVASTSEDDSNLQAALVHLKDFLQISYVLISWIVKVFGLSGGS